MRKYMYTVVYVSEYDGLEMYCRVCGIFPNQVEANAFICGEMNKLIEELGEDFDGTIDTNYQTMECIVRDSRQRHQWFINQIYLDYDFDVHSTLF